MQFFNFEKVREHLKKHVSFIHTCDREAIEAINSPVADFTLAPQ
jgi:hemerythrin